MKEKKHVVTLQINHDLLQKINTEKRKNSEITKSATIRRILVSFFDKKLDF